MRFARFALTFAPGSLGAVFLWHEVLECYPYKVTPPTIDLAGHVSAAAGFVAAFSLGVAAVAKGGWLWPLLSGVAGPAGFTIAIVRAHYLAATLPPSTVEFNWPTSAVALDHVVANALLVTVCLGGLFAAVLHLIPGRD